MFALTVSRTEAAERLQAQIAKGEALLGEEIRSKGELDAARDRYYSWSEYNTNLLKKLFTTGEEADSYSSFHGGGWVGGAYLLSKEIEDHHDDVRSKIRRLTSVLERLELFDEPSAADAPSAPETQEEVARLLVETLEAVRESEFSNRTLIREAQALNARLAPTYTSMYGRVPVITTTYPPHVWFPRALDVAEQALAVASAGASVPASKPREEASDRVFIVHGHDDGLKEAVARLVESFGYRAVILHERDDRGQTIIEKFERESPDVAFAVVLLTPDDEGRVMKAEGGAVKADLAPRARQNVVWEFGYFAALLTRGRVAALVVSHNDLEPPSDLDGLLYIPVRSIGDQNWRMRLAKEMRAAGLDIDLNKVE